ncbi:MAG TPA: hypothetical protein VN616_05330 [Puia sp.]|nr:hypothetical protein [Puia sp.]
MKYITLITRHYNGFSMWDTRKMGLPDRREGHALCASSRSRYRTSAATAFSLFKNRVAIEVSN